MGHNDNLLKFGAYQKALELFDLCHEIIGILTASIRTLRNQQ
jgi:hypothetical protein